jgi:hypothetical protein
MAFSARIPSTLDTNKFVPEIFSKNVLVAVKHKLVAAPFVNHSYEKELSKGDTLYITATNVVTATEITIGTEGVQSNPFNTAAKTLTIDKYYEAPVTLDFVSRRQSQVDLIAKAEAESAYAISKVIDTSVCDLFSTLNSDSVAGTDGSPWTDDVLILAVETLDARDIPEENRAWFGDPSTKADILKIDKFVRVDYGYGDQIPTGMFRKDIYGSPLLITNNLTAYSTGSYGCYLHKDAIGLAISQKLNAYSVEQKLKHQLVLNTEALWGVGEIRNDFGYPIYTRDA